MPRTERIHQYMGPRGGGTCGFLLDTGRVCGRTEIVHEVEMMSTPDAWPTWPVLPLKRYADNGGGFADLEVAFLMEQSPKDAKILYKRTIYEVQAAVRDPSCQERFETFEDIYDAGYRVD